MQNSRDRPLSSADTTPFVEETQQHVQYGVLDWTRLAACLSVIAIHAAYVSGVRLVDRVCFWALPFFFLASGCLAASRLADASWLRTRFLHLIGLLLPWLLIARVITFADSGLHYTLRDLAGDLFLGSAWGHLWFLPALIMVTVVAWLAARLQVQLIALACGAALAVAVLLVMPWVSPRWSDVLYRAPFYWFVFFMAGVCWERLSMPRRLAPASVLTLGAAGVALQVWAGWLPSSAQRSTYLLGSGLVAVAVCRYAFKAAPRVASGRVLAGATLGVYLGHLFLISAFKVTLPGLVANIAALWATTAVVTFVVVLLLLRVPGVRRLLS